MPLHTLLLPLATLLCALTAGLVFAFTVVVMPGIRALPDRDFLLSFKVMDAVIQQRDARFMAVWVGSLLVLLAATLTALGPLDGLPSIILVSTTLTYLVGVHVPTAMINIPLNNRLQALDLDALDADALRAARDAFEGRWTYWNAVRTVFACASTVALLVVLVAL